jgi:hypothetical protein
MTDSRDGTFDMSELDAELDRLLAGATPSAQAPAWCGDVAVLVRTALAPARPDELAREAEIVAQMRALRLAVLAEAEAATAGSAGEAGAESDAAPAIAAAATEPESDAAPAIAAARDAPIVTAEADEPPTGDAAGDEAEPAPARAGAYRDAGPPVIDLRAPRPPIDLDEYRAKHAGERYYRAKHAAARLEASKHPLARTVGRVVAIKAVAVTTAIGIAAAAAAATTGLVATVVVPALTQPEHHATTTTPAPATRGPELGTTATRHARSGKGTATTERSECASVLPACVPLPAALVPTVTKEVADRAAAMTASADTTQPKTTPTVEPTPTTAPEPPATTVPEPAPTTEPPTTVPESPPTTEPPTTTPPPPDPGGGATGLSAGGDPTP